MVMSMEKTQKCHSSTRGMSAKRIRPDFVHPLTHSVGKTFENSSKHSHKPQRHPVRTIRAVEIRPASQGSILDGYWIAYSVPDHAEWIWSPASNFNQWLRNARRRTA